MRKSLSFFAVLLAALIFTLTTANAQTVTLTGTR